MQHWHPAQVVFVFCSSPRDYRMDNRRREIKIQKRPLPQNEWGRLEERKKQFLNSWIHHFILGWRKFLLGFFLIRRKKEAFFETAEKVFRNNRGQMSGNSVKIGDGCATVTATNSNATGNGKAE